MRKKILSPRVRICIFPKIERISSIDIAEEETEETEDANIHSCKINDKQEL